MKFITYKCDCCGKGTSKAGRLQMSDDDSGETLTLHFCFECWISVSALFATGLADLKKSREIRTGAS